MMGQNVAETSVYTGSDIYFRRRGMDNDMRERWVSEAGIIYADAGKKGEYVR
jgi:hypothetical protein